MITVPWYFSFVVCGAVCVFVFIMAVWFLFDGLRGKR